MSSTLLTFRGCMSNEMIRDEAIISALASKPKLLTITHVDTSTGVLSPADHIASLVKKHSPSTLIALDAVCSVASEEIRFDDWGLDVVLSATQKGLGVPPGLSVVLASKRAVEVRVSYILISAQLNTTRPLRKGRLLSPRTTSPGRSGFPLCRTMKAESHLILQLVSRAFLSSFRDLLTFSKPPFSSCMRFTHLSSPLLLPLWQTVSRLTRLPAPTLRTASPNLDLNSSPRAATSLQTV